MKLKIFVFLLIFFLLIPVIFIKAAASDNQKGRIFLQVESHGEAWYVSPKDGKRYYMANGGEAFQIMKNLGVGISNKDMDKIKIDANFRKKLIGKILLQVESHGEAYYISFDNRYNYLKDGQAAYSVMSSFGLGITNKNLSKIVDYKTGNQIKIQPTNGDLANTPTDNKKITSEIGANIDSSCPKTVKYDGGPFDDNGAINNMGGYYRTIKIGKQCWFKDDLNNGIMVNGKVDQTNNDVIEKYCYEDDQINCNLYGGLYNWDEATLYGTTKTGQGICPQGWHIPTWPEIQTLSMFIGSNGDAKLKSARTAVPNAGNSAYQPVGISTNIRPRWSYSMYGYGTDEFGFSALPAGLRDIHGLFSHLDWNFYLWSLSPSSDNPANIRLMTLGDSSSIYSLGYHDFERANGFSVRCLKD